MVYFNCKKRKERSWAFVDVCAAPSVLDVRFSLGNSEKQQPCPPTAEAPVGPQKRKRKMSPRFEDFWGQEKKICLMRPRDVSPSREKQTLSGSPPPTPAPRRGGREGKQTRGGGGDARTCSNVFCAHRSPEGVFLKTTVGRLS